MRNLINILDLSVEEIDRLIEVADDIIQNPQNYNEVARHQDTCDSFLRAFHQNPTQL